LPRVLVLYNSTTPPPQSTELTIKRNYYYFFLALYIYILFSTSFTAIYIYFFFRERLFLYIISVCQSTVCFATINSSTRTPTRTINDLIYIILLTGLCRYNNHSIRTHPHHSSSPAAAVFDA